MQENLKKEKVQNIEKNKNLLVNQDIQFIMI